MTIGKEIEKGTRYNSWTIIDEIPIENRKNRLEREFNCICECGVKDIVNFKNLKYSKSKSCKFCMGKRLSILNKKKWIPIDNGDNYLIPLTKNKYALIDKEDFYKIKDDSWFLKNGYAYSNKNKDVMHRYLFDHLTDEIAVHHINENKLDNRKCNLKFLSLKEHMNHHRKYIDSFRKCIINKKERETQ